MNTNRLFSALKLEVSNYDSATHFPTKSFL